MSTSGHVLPFNPKTHTPLIPYLAALHASCITQDHLIATFLPPLSHEKLLSWWKERIAEIVAGTRLMWILVKETTEKEVTGPDVVGVVMLSMPVSETGRLRGGVEKLLIHVNWRRRGGASKLLGVLEEEAKDRGRTILELDTETGSDGDFLYPKVGYIELGRIPNCELSPSGESKECTFYWKQL